MNSLLEVKNLKKSYKQSGKETVAIEDISFTVSEGEILGIVGESGCGKSSLAKCVIGLTEPDGGEVVWRGRVISGLSEKERRPIRKDIQMIFQNPFSSFNPRLTVGRSFKRVAMLYKMSDADYEKKLGGLLKDCGIDEELLDRRPSQLSGGQLQRLAIVRALLTDPKLLIADEAVSALDVSVQEQILKLLAELRDRYGIAVLFISHDLAVVKAICQRVIVMYKGSIMEQGSVDDLFSLPAHPYTKALLSARPRLYPSDEPRIVLKGDVSEQSGDGCLFAGRCYIEKCEQCFKKRPQQSDIGDGHMVACCCLKI